MNTLYAIFAILVERGPAIAIATTAVLGVAALVVVISRNPLHRERTAAIGIASAALAFVLMLVPLPGPVGQWAALLEVKNAPTEPAVVVAGSLPWNIGAQADYGAVDFDSDAIAAAPISYQPRPVISGAATIQSPLLDVEAEPKPTSPGWARLLVIGFGFMLLYFVFSTLALTRLAAKAVPIPKWLTALLPENSRAKLLLCRRSPRPFCFGFKNARVVLPAHLAKPKNQELLRTVVQQELAHVDLGHPRWRQVIAVCSLLLFPHPLFWWLARQQREAAELLADDQAAAFIGKTSYVKQLIALVEQLRPKHQRHSLSGNLAVLSAPQLADGPFYLRMKSLLMRPTTLHTNFSRTQTALRGAACLALLLAVTLAFGRPVVAQDAPLANPFGDAPNVSAPLPTMADLAFPSNQGFDVEAEFSNPAGVGEFLCWLTDQDIAFNNVHITKAGTNGERRLMVSIHAGSPDALVAQADALAALSGLNFSYRGQVLDVQGRVISEAAIVPTANQKALDFLARAAAPDPDEAVTGYVVDLSGITIGRLALDGTVIAVDPQGNPLATTVPAPSVGGRVGFAPGVDSSPPVATAQAYTSGVIGRLLQDDHLATQLPVDLLGSRYDPKKYKDFEDFTDEELRQLIAEMQKDLERLNKLILQR